MDGFVLVIQLLILAPFFGLVIWFWVLIFKLLIRLNKALQIYLDKANK